MSYISKKKSAKRVRIFFGAALLLLTALNLLGGAGGGSFALDALNAWRLQFFYAGIVFSLWAFFSRAFPLGTGFLLLGLYSFVVIASQTVVYQGESLFAGEPSVRLTAASFAFSDDPVREADVMADLDEHDPDIVLVRDVSAISADEKKRLVKAISSRYAHRYGITLREKPARESLLLFSKRPWTGSPVPLRLDAGGEPFGYRVEFEAGGAPFVLAAASLPKAADGVSYAEARGYVDALERFVRLHTERIILFGGFETPPFTFLIRRLKASTYLRTRAAFAPDYPAYLPFFLRRGMNYAYAHPGIEVEETDLGRANGSLYLPQILRLEVYARKD